MVKNSLVGVAVLSHLALASNIYEGIDRISRSMDTNFKSNPFFKKFNKNKTKQKKKK